jgi:hypothetical protein
MIEGLHYPFAVGHHDLIHLAKGSSQGGLHGNRCDGEYILDNLRLENLPARARDSLAEQSDVKYVCCIIRFFVLLFIMLYNWFEERPHKKLF